MSYIDIIKQRRSVYDLHKHLPISEKKLMRILEEVITESPTAFNMQSSQVIVLLDGQHERLWNIVTKTLKEVVPSEKFEPTQKKMDMFTNAKGTLLFFENTQIIEQLKKEYPVYKDKFDDFALRSMGILQGNIWNALAEAEIGASLQHYNPLIDKAIKEEWDIPEHYELSSQMVFGGIGSIPEPKEKIEAHSRLSLHK